MTTRLFLPLFAVSVLLLGPLPGARAAAESAPTSLTVDLAEGSTVGDLVLALKENKSDLNIVLAPQVASRKLGAIRVRAVDLATFAQVVQVASAGTVLPTIQNNQTLGLSLAGALSRANVHAFQVGAYLKDDPATRLKALTGTIEQTLEAVNKRDGNEEFVEFKLFPDAGVLVVIGSEKALSTAAAIVEALPKAERPPVAPAKP